MQLLEKKIHDQRFIELIRKALNAGYLFHREHVSDIVGTPQGSIISPILANIFLHELDVFIEQLKLEFDSSSTSKKRSREYGQVRYLLAKAKLLDDPELRARELRKYGNLLRNTVSKSSGAENRKILYVRYADD